MSQTRVLVLLAGAALSFGAPALAQNANLDQDRAYAAELVNDAGSRASLLQGGGGGAGHDSKGFFISDGTGNNSLYIGGAAQFRYAHNFRDDSVVGENEDFTHGFSNTNVRLWTMGNIWSKDLSYKVQFNLESGSAELEDAWAQYSWESGFSMKWGQFKAPVFREESVNNEHQLAMDRSNSNDVFSQGWSQGIAGTYTTDSFRITGGFTDGANTANTDFDSGDETDYALTLRADVKVAGSDWSRFDDFTSFKNQDTAGVIGGAIHWENGGETNGTADVESLFYTIDAQFEGAGWNVFAAFMGASQDFGGGGNTDDYGFLLQGGLFLADQAEAFARWDSIYWDDSRATDDNHFITAGLNYYISPESHAVKFTGQVTWALSETAGLGFDNNAILGQAADDEVSLGFQMQVMF